MEKMFDKPQIQRGNPITLEQAVMELLPVTGSVEVQRDTPGREHPTHTHPTHETLLIVNGSITFTIGEESLVKRPLFKVFGLFTLAVVALTMGTFGWWLLYPLALMLFGGWMMRMRLRRNAQSDTVGIAK
ncbi:hypothetical protein [Laceyella putida]|uniref:Uncharacterized protein n=1 Tax=Laceyella putida TaxID=110101 RepID=A0ABW2RPK8_9BACL